MSVALIPMANNSSMCAAVDEADLHLVSSYVWYAYKIGRNWYAMTEVVNNGKSRRLYMHRLITGASGKLEVDHINGDGMDNTRANLRIVSHQQNLVNQRLSSASTTGFKGVTLDRRTAKDGSPLTPAWMAQTKYNGRRIYLGKFSTPEAAARAYDRKMIELHGEFAKTNASLGLIPPDDGEPLAPNFHEGGRKSRKKKTEA